MAVTPGTLKSKFKELAGASAGDLQPWIDEAERNVCRSAWGSRADDGVSYLSAHLYTCFGKTTGGGNAAGPVTSKKVDQLQATYKVGDVFADSDLGTTKFGRRFLSLSRLQFAGRCI